MLFINLEACSPSDYGTIVKKNYISLGTASVSSPLYYSIHHGRLTFASEIKALIERPQSKEGCERGSSLPLSNIFNYTQAHKLCLTEYKNWRQEPGCG